jgi:hypothetical protein
MPRPYPHSDSEFTWEDFYEKNPQLKPTPEQLLEALENYGGDNYDTHYWT